VSAYLEVLIPAVKSLPEVARAIDACMSASAAETQAAKKEQQEQRERLEASEAKINALQGELSRLLARCDQDLQQVREETQAAKSLAHEQVAELLVRPTTSASHDVQRFGIFTKQKQHESTAPAL
jgi:peptidoglycan hydrolase CwlO-like protein